VDDAVVEIPGIGGGFDGDDVGGEEMVAGPGGPFFKGNFEGFEDNFLEGVDGGDIKEVLARPGGLGQGGDRRRRTEQYLNGMVLTCYTPFVGNSVGADSG
jgi:hypothetical protein